MIETKDMNTLQKALAARLIALAEESLGRGEIAEAERLYREVVHFLELILDPNHVEIAKTLYKLAYILEFQERASESLDLIRRARAIIRGAVKQTLTAESVMTPFVWERPS